jgi:tetratricopeptide (TPR) repeat protein
MNMNKTRVLVMLIVSALSMGGCASMAKQGANVTAAAQLDPADQKKPLTRVEQEEAHWRAHGEGLRLIQDGQYGLAIGAFETALKTQPDSTDAMFNLGACHEAIGDPLKAINYYRRVLEVTPNDPDCYRNLGTSFIKLYHRESSPAWKKMATDAWRQSLRLKPNQPDVRSFLASVPNVD